MIYADTWRRIVEASGLEDAASESYGHDLLDGIAPEAYGAPLADTFAILCREHGAQSCTDLDQILDRFRRAIPELAGLRLPDEWLAEEARAATAPERIGITDHTSQARGTYSDNWGTPEDVIDLVWQLYGPITHDLASCAEHNERVRARCYWSREAPCPALPELGSGSVVWCNPPGPRTRVEYFWQAWNHAIAAGAAGGFLIFKQDHWRALPPPAIECTAVLLRQRLPFVRSAEEIHELQRKAERENKPYHKPGGASFPSTLILTGRQFYAARRAGMFASSGHALIWEPMP